MSRPVTVSQLLTQVRDTLSREGAFRSVLLEGELSNYSRSPSGHLYFVLKDRRCQLRCLMFGSDARRLRFKPRDGMTVVARGQVSLYGAKGDLQFQVQAMRADGLGQLYEALGKLKHRLHAEGLFDRRRRRPLPLFPKRVGLVTSMQGAVLHDIATTLRRRNPAVALTVCPASVQGELAVGELVRGVARLQDHVDCLIVARGGGSFEDLLPFNSEPLVRAVAACRCPIISAVGHETDVTLCDLAADKRAPTPTAAAELVAAPTRELGEQLSQYRSRMRNALENRSRQQRQLLERLQHSPCLRYPMRMVENEMQRLDDYRMRLPWLLQRRYAREHERLTGLGQRLQRQQPGRLLELARGQLRELRQRFSRGLGPTLNREEMRLRALQGRLEALSPMRVLERGFALVLDQQGQPVLGVEGRSPGETLEVRLADGRLKVFVESVETESEAPFERPQRVDL